MTREEAILCLSVHSSTNGSGLCTDEQHYEAKQMAIKALEQQPCSDAISRKVLKDLGAECIAKRDENGNLIPLGSIDSLPPVSTGKPNKCEDAVSRQAVLDGLASIAKAKAKSDAQKSMMGRTMFFVERLPSVSTGKTVAYKQGWHDAIVTALKETHSVHTEGGNFRVVQEETLIGMGMAYEPQESEVQDADSN